MLLGQGVTCGSKNSSENRLWDGKPNMGWWRSFRESLVPWSVQHMWEMFLLKWILDSTRHITWNQHSYVAHNYNWTVWIKQVLLYGNYNLPLQFGAIIWWEIWVYRSLVKLLLPLLPGQEVIWQPGFLHPNKQEFVCWNWEQMLNHFGKQTD